MGQRRTCDRAVVKVRYGRDCVAKVGGMRRVRNNRIQKTCLLNQSCAANRVLIKIASTDTQNSFATQSQGKRTWAGEVSLQTDLQTDHTTRQGIEHHMAKALTLDEAKRIASNIVTLPALPRKES